MKREELAEKLKEVVGRLLWERLGDCEILADAVALLEVDLGVEIEEVLAGVLQPEKMG